MPANLRDVQQLIKQGKRKEAGQMLQRVLKENPSADAWYFAARMSSNPETAVQYLKRAVQMDPKHTEARQELKKRSKELATGKKSSSRKGSGIGGLALIFVMILLFIVSIGVGSLVRNVFLAEPPQPIKEPSQALAIAPDNLVTQLESLANLEELRDAPTTGEALQQWELVLDDGSIAQVYLYETLSAMTNDRPTLFDQLASDQYLITYHSVAVTYPVSMELAQSQQLQQTVSGIPLSEEVLEPPPDIIPAEVDNTSAEETTTEEDATAEPAPQSSS